MKIIKKTRNSILFTIIGLLAIHANGQNCLYESPFDNPKGILEESFKVLSINIYGQQIEGLVDLFTPFNDGDCQDRLREIGSYIRDSSPRYDIVGVQEWHPDTSVTCNGEVFRNRIDDNYDSPVSGFYTAEKGFKWSHYRWGHPEAYDQKDGGLGIISETPFLWKEYDEGDFGTVWELADGHPVETENVHQFHPRLMPRTAHGFIFARIYLRYPDIAIDTYVVHLTSRGNWPNSCNDACKVYMLEQLREGIHERSASSGFPVLIMGDFNIGGPDPVECVGDNGYGAIMKNLGNPIDLWLDAHPNTAGSTTHWKKDSAKRIDYMFIPNDPYLVNSPYEITIKTPSSSDKKDWTVRLNELSDSDHLGLEADLEVRQKLNWATVFTAIGL